MQSRLNLHKGAVDCGRRVIAVGFVGPGWRRFAQALTLGLLWLLLPPVAAQSAAEENVLVLGVRADAPPFSYLASGEGEKERFLGYSVTLCQLIAKRAIREGLYCDLEYQQVSASDRFTLLKDGQIDLLCGASTITLERMRIADFSLFTFLSGASIMYRTPDSQPSGGQRSTFRVGVLKDTTTEKKAKDIIYDFRNGTRIEAWQDLEVEVEDVDNHYVGLEKLLGRHLEAYVADREILLAMKQRAELSAVNQRSGGSSNVNLIVSRDYFTVEHYAIMLGRGKLELRFIANQVLSQMFNWNYPTPGRVQIFDVLRQSFPGKKFSKSLEDMFRLQRVDEGSQLLPRPKRVDCRPSDS